MIQNHQTRFPRKLCIQSSNWLIPFCQCLQEHKSKTRLAGGNGPSWNLVVYGHPHKFLVGLGPICFVCALIPVIRQHSLSSAGEAYFTRARLCVLVALDSRTSLEYARGVFLTRNNLHFMLHLSSTGDKFQKAPVQKLLTWEIITHKFPWNIVLLLGGGFALAETSKVLVYVGQGANLLIC
jgi:hypothetical protein